MEVSVFVEDAQTDKGTYIYPGVVAIEVPDDYNDDIVADVLHNYLEEVYGATIDSFCWNYNTNQPKVLQCRFIDYKITGEVIINLWGGGKGIMNMTSFHVTDLNDINKYINDGGFGCESISVAKIQIYETYEYGASKFIEEKFVSISENINDNLISMFDK